MTPNSQLRQSGNAQQKEKNISVWTVQLKFHCIKKYDTRFMAEAIEKNPEKKNNSISVQTAQMAFYQLKFRCIKKCDTRFIAEAIEKYPAEKKTFQFGPYRFLLPASSSNAQRNITPDLQLRQSRNTQKKKTTTTTTFQCRLHRLRFTNLSSAV